MKWAKEDRRIWPDTGCLNISLRCWGLRLSGPVADPQGNDLIVAAISSVETEMEEGGTSGGGGMEVSGCGGGCLSWRAANVESLLSARESSEHASLTAPLKSPSSNLAETCAASCNMGS